MSVDQMFCVFFSNGNGYLKAVQLKNMAFVINVAGWQRRQTWIHWRRIKWRHGEHTYYIGCRLS